MSVYSKAMELYLDLYEGAKKLKPEIREKIWEFLSKLHEEASRLVYEQDPAKRRAIARQLDALGWKIQKTGFGFQELGSQLRQLASELREESNHGK